MTLHHNTRHRRGFTLVELLTVVGIIALLIGILIPSLSKARDQARKVKTSAQISATEKGLEMFQNDFNQYPDSSTRVFNKAGNLVSREDPITNFPDAGGTNQLSGAHWLVRAMAGHDLQGVDGGGLSLRSRIDVKVEGNVPVAANGDGSGATMEDFRNVDRKGVYMEGTIYFRDTDPKFNPTGTPNTGRPVMVDTYGYPVLYYRANPRAKKAFSLQADDAAAIGGVKGVGVYNHEDNLALTGTGVDGTGWSFTAGTTPHPFGKFEPNSYHTLAGSKLIHENKGSFIDFLHNESVHEMSSGTSSIVPVVRALNPETFILLTPGADGLYGTTDDVSNIKK